VAGSGGFEQASDPEKRVAAEFEGIAVGVIDSANDHIDGLEAV